MNGFHGTKWSCLHIMSVFVSNAENGCGTHSLHLCFYPLNDKGDIDVHADADAYANANITCKQSLTPSRSFDAEIGPCE